MDHKPSAIFEKKKQTVAMTDKQFTSEI